MTAVGPGRSGDTIRRREAVISAALVIALLAASAALVLDFSALKSPGFHPPPGQVTVTQGPQTGKLIIAVSLSRSANTIGLQFPVSSPPSEGNFTLLPLFAPLQQLDPVNFSISSSDSRFPTIHVPVRQPGSFELPMQPDLYFVSTSNEFYNFTTEVTISSGQVSELDVRVTQDGIFPTFVQFGDPEHAGVISPWQTLVLVVPYLPQVPPPGGNIFLGIASSLVTLNNASGVVGVTCVSSCHPTGPFFSRAAVILSQKGLGGLMLEVRLFQPIPINSSTLFVYSIRETHQVTEVG